jgi:hypothetical protein
LGWDHPLIPKINHSASHDIDLAGREFTDLDILSDVHFWLRCGGLPARLYLLPNLARQSVIPNTKWRYAAHAVPFGTDTP